MRMTEKLTHLSLFTGIGGIDLAAEWAGFETIGQCEWGDYATKVLEKHWPFVPKWKDIRTLTGDNFYERTGMRTVDIISGGFPCQPYSIAGKQRGKEDDRYLWPEMLRVVQEIKPTWVLGENVVGILGLGIEKILFDLESTGYQGGVFQIPACSIGAAHKRDRVFIVSYAIGKRWDGLEQEPSIRRPDIDISNAFKPWNNAEHLSLDFYGTISNPSSGKKRNDDGLSEGMDRLECIGNAVVPQQVFPILKSIAEIEINLRRKAE